LHRLASPCRQLSQSRESDQVHGPACDLDCLTGRYQSLTLAIGYEIIWRGERGWATTRARQLLLGQRTVGGSRKETDRAPNAFLVAKALNAIEQMKQGEKIQTQEATQC
jgi:hypothetical protein